uniref:Glutaredoxin and cysteine rich domain containing 2 n=1 Tax=Macaca mulatta TaxID=9544 RepID=A0A5F7ZFZ2_MACMU
MATILTICIVSPAFVNTVLQVFHGTSHPQKLTQEPCSISREANRVLERPLPIIDFGKIIIYTNNLKIIRTPMDKRDFVRKILQKEEEAEEESLMNKEESCGGRDQQDRPLVEAESTFPHNRYTQEGDIPEDSCFHCRGSGSATCSLCHGSKFSMLANRFKESYRALRCPACNENGLQPCQICNQ